MRRHEFQAPLEKEGNNGVWGAMAGYSFTAMHQFSCDSSPDPPDPHCLFACHIQLAWPFFCLSIYIYPFCPLGSPTPPTRCHVWTEKGARGGIRVVEGAGLRHLQWATNTPLSSVEVAVRDPPSHPHSLTGLPDDDDAVTGNWSPHLSPVSRTAG